MVLVMVFVFYLLLLSHHAATKALYQNLLISRKVNYVRVVIDRCKPKTLMVLSNKSTLLADCSGCSACGGVPAPHGLKILANITSQILLTTTMHLFGPPHILWINFELLEKMAHFDRCEP